MEVLSVFLSHLGKHWKTIQLAALLIVTKSLEGSLFQNVLAESNSTVTGPSFTSSTRIVS
jgi:hypothetical protein